MDPPPLYDCLEVLANLATHVQELAHSLAPDQDILTTPLEIHKLRRENVELRAAVAFLMVNGGHLPVPRHTPRPTLSTLPADIVHLIFEEAIPATYQYDTSMPPSPSNPWLSVLATKAALPLICRALYWEGMSILYNDIVLRRMSQIFVLARTLRSTRGADIQPLIRIVRMASCPVGGDFAWRAREDLEFILRECHALRSLSYHPHPNFPLLYDENQESSGGSYFNPMWFFHVSTSRAQPPFLDGFVGSRLHRLNLQFILTESRLRNLHDLLLGTTSLQSLVLDYPIQSFVLSEAPEGLSAVRLLSLVELYIPFGQDAIFDEYICTRWEMPKLARVTLVSFQWWPKRLLERFGGRLVYLHVFARHHLHAFSCNIDPCATLASHCPTLEHLVIPNPHSCLQQFPATTVHSPTLKHLDIWDFGTSKRLMTRARYYRWQEPVASISGGWVENVRSNGSVPALQTVRFLFTEYGEYRGVDWPSICHPDLLSDRPNDEIWHTFPNAYVAQTATCLIPYSPHPVPDDVTDESMAESDSDHDWMPSSSCLSEDDADSEPCGSTDGDMVEDAVEGCYI